MTNDDPDILVQRFIDGDLSEGEVQEALHHIADDAEARDLLQFELRMTQDLAATRSQSAPEDFAARTMDAVARTPAPGEDNDTLREQLRSWWAAMTGAVTLRVRPVSVAVAVLLLGIGAWALWSTGPAGVQEGVRSTITTASSESAAAQQTTKQVSSNGQTVWVRFLYPNSEADSVAVAGDFSEWEPVSLSPRTVDGKTVWTGLVPVSRGEHEYQFLINGDRWVPDPLAPVTRSDGFGAKNAVLNV